MGKVRQHGRGNRIRVSARQRHPRPFRAGRRTDPTTPNAHNTQDALPGALALGGTWLAARALGDRDGRREAGTMFEAAVFSSISTELLKRIADRQRPVRCRRPQRLRRGRRLVPVGARDGRVRDRRGARRVGQRSAALAAAYTRLRHRRPHRLRTHESRPTLVLGHRRRRRRRHRHGALPDEAPRRRRTTARSRSCPPTTGSRSATPPYFDERASAAPSVQGPSRDTPEIASLRLVCAHPCAQTVPRGALHTRRS